MTDKKQALKKARKRFVWRDNYTIMPRAIMPMLKNITSCELHVLLTISKLIYHYKDHSKWRGTFSCITSFSEIVNLSGLSRRVVFEMVRRLEKKRYISKQPLDKEELATLNRTRKFRVFIQYTQSGDFQNEFPLSLDREDLKTKGYIEIPNYSHFGSMYTKGYELVVYVTLCMCAKGKNWKLYNTKTQRAYNASYLEKLVSIHVKSISRCITNLVKKGFIKKHYRKPPAHSFPILEIIVKYE